MSRTTTTTTRNILRILGQTSRCRLTPGSSPINLQKRRYSHHNAHAVAPQVSEECPQRVLKNQLRVFFREMAQPVAVVTSWMPSKPSSSRQDDALTRNSSAPAFVHHTHSKFHGATLSSFASIAMDPYPLVSFALRVPSRMATTLAALPKSSPSHMVINLLSAGQADSAIKFSRPDLHPEPFREGAGIGYGLTKEGLPVLDGVLGAMSCQLVAGPIPLHDLQSLNAAWSPVSSDLDCALAHTNPQLEEGEVASELFIARVTRIEALADLTTNERTLTTPLLYYRRQYTSCADS